MKIFKKGDIILFFCIASVCTVLTVLLYRFSPLGKTVVINQNNQQIGTYPLTKNQIIELSGNTVAIHNGAVSINDASCPKEICKNHNQITKKGQSIICLPNKVIVEIR